MKTGEYFRTANDGIKIEKLDRKAAEDHCGHVRARAIRLYTRLSGSRGVDSQWSFALQLRGPLMLGFGGTKEGKDFIIATAHLSPNELRDLRDAIDAKLKEFSDVINAAARAQHDPSEGSAR